jgi:hypothetical protein
MAANTPRAGDVGFGQPQEAVNAYGNVQFMDYDAYRNLCSKADNFHRVGILDDEDYVGAISDPRTVSIEVGNKLVPLVTPLEYEGGYDAQRAAALSGHAQAFLATLPVSSMIDGTLDNAKLSGGEGIGDDFSIIIEQPEVPGSDTEAVRCRVASFLSGMGPLVAREFIDPRVIEYEGHGPAWLSLYSFSFGPTEMALATPAASSYEDAWTEYCRDNGIDKMPDEKATGTFLFNPAQLIEHPEIVNALWEISEVGFGNILGMYHPVSMEETKQFFQDHLFADLTYTAVYFQEGEPICFGSLVFDINACEWLDAESTSLRKELALAEQNNEVAVWFSEIVSKGISGSQHVFQLLLDLAGRTHEKYRLMHESSNFASTYILPYGDKQVRKAPRVVHTRENQKHDRIDYWFLEREKTESTER